MGRVQSSDLPEPTDDTAYLAGSFVSSDKYDKPQGSQSSQPSHDYSEAEPSPSTFRMYQDPDDEEFAIVEGVRPSSDQVSVPIPSGEVDDDDDDFVIVPQT